MSQNRNFKSGDRIAMLNESVTGIILHIDKNEVIILSDDDFEYTCKISEIVPNSNLNSLIDKSLHKDFPKIIKTSKHKKGNPKNKSSSIMEVDLHIHELVSSEKGMSNFEMLTIQLNTAKIKLEQAIKNKNQRIVFIHGVGEGILKNELYKLFKKYPVDFFDASYQKYGQGATEVYIYQNKK